MEDKPKKRDKPERPQQEVYPLRKLFDVDDERLELKKINEIAKLVLLPGSLSEEDKTLLVARALDLYESLAPADGLEGMLAVQMVGTHHAILECLSRAAVPKQTYQSLDVNLKYAAKLMTLYTQQVTALDKHRGKGQQKVTVEHVHVAPGGQAIVGNVETGGAKKPSSPEPTAIDHFEEIPVEIDPEQTKAGRGKASEE